MADSRRPRGTGRLYQKHGAWYGTWRVGSRRLNRKLGPVRVPHRDGGITRSEAEKRLRREMEALRPTAMEGRQSFDDIAAMHISRLELLGRKPSTIQDYRSHLRTHFEPAFGPLEIGSIRRRDIERFQMQKLGELAPKTVRNLMASLHGIFQFALRQEHIVINPVGLVEKPSAPRSRDLKYLTLAQLDAIIAAVPSDDLGAMERVLYLVAAMTGLRQGEVLALRWRDVDWAASRIRVRESVSRGDVGTPKSLQSTRAVPLSQEAARELELHFQRSTFQGDSDRVFCHPSTGKIYDRSKCLKRFKSARDAAGAPPVTFHGLRHTFGTKMAMAGVPLRTIQHWMGHESSTTTEIYSHYTPGEREAEIVERAFRRESDRSPALRRSSDRRTNIGPLATR